MAANDQAHIYNFYVQLGHINIKSTLKNIYIFYKHQPYPKLNALKLWFQKKYFSISLIYLSFIVEHWLKSIQF